MAATLPYPDMSVQVALNARPNSSDNPRWTDLTELVIAADNITRGKLYEVPTSQTSTPTITIRDVLEQFNRDNAATSPFINGAGGRDVQPYRGVCWQAMHPRGGTGNLLNLQNWRVPIDPSFNSYTAGTQPSWVVHFGGITSSAQVTATAPFEGTRCYTWNVAVSGGFQGIGVNFPCMPGRYYKVSAYVKQTAANTASISVAGHADLNTTATTGAYVRLSGVIYADQPNLLLLVGNDTAAATGVFSLDAIMIEPAIPLNSTLNFNRSTGGFVGANGAKVTQWNVSSVASAAGFHLGSLLVTPDGVTSTPQALGPELPVTGNTKYWVGSILQAFSLTRSYSVNWYTAAHAFISASTFSATYGLDWTVNDPVAVTSPGTAAFARLSTEGPGVSATGWKLDNIDLVADAPSAFTTSGPVIYPVLRDWVERWPRRFESNGFEGYADLQLVDGFAALNAIRLHTDYVQSVLAKSPDYYWRLAEPGGATTFIDSSGNNGPSLTRLDSVAGPGLQFDLGALTNIPGVPGGTGLTTATDPNGVTAPVSIAQIGLFHGPTPFFMNGQHATMAIWASHGVVSSAPSNYASMGILSLRQNFNTQNGGVLGLQVSGVTLPPNLLAQYAPGGSGWTGLSISVPDIWSDDKPHLYIVTLDVAGGVATLVLYIDGVQIATGSQAVTGSPIFGWDSAQVGGEWTPWTADATLANQGTPVTQSEWALWNRVLSGAELADLWNAGKGYPGELPSTRINRRLSLGGYLTGNNNVPTSRVSAGRSIMGRSSSVERTPALQDTQNITTAEMGTLWIAPDGAMVMESRDDRFLRLASTMTFGEDLANGECPYQPGITFDFDPLYTYADVQITQTGGIIATGGRAADITAVAATYFGRSFTLPNPVDLRDAAQAQDYADWVFYTHNSAAQRVRSITVDPMSNPALWPFVFNSEVGRRVTLKRRPQGLAGSVVYSSQYFVEQVGHSGINFDTSDDKPLSWLTTLYLSPIPPTAQPWLLNDPTYSVLNSTTRLGF